jgi:hypothetical protein
VPWEHEHPVQFRTMPPNYIQKGETVAKTINIEIDGGGKMHVDYSGFVGNACFQAADELKVALAVYGVDVDVVKVDPKKDEVEVRKLENSAKVGA